MQLLVSPKIHKIVDIGIRQLNFVSLSIQAVLSVRNDEIYYTTIEFLKEDQYIYI